MRYCFVLAVVPVLVGSDWFVPRVTHVSARTIPPAPVTFVEVPPSESKITWVHDNGRSEARHLPETCGGGGLFFDYDNDGFMVIYLVNSGPSDFYTSKSPIKNALYHSDGADTFTDVTHTASVGCGRMGDLGMCAAVA